MNDDNLIFKYFCAKCRQEVTVDNLTPKKEYGGIAWYCPNCNKVYEYTWPNSNLIAKPRG